MSKLSDPVAQTYHWLNAIVVGLNLCPFAAPVLKAETLHIEVCHGLETEQLLRAVLEQLDKLQGCEESEIATSLLVFSHAVKDFDHYWGLVELAEELLAEAGLEGVIQIASFHPDYCFEGVAADDASNYSNRSPYPMLHFIREAQLTRVLAQYPNPEQIPDNNIQKLRELGTEHLIRLITTH